MEEHGKINKDTITKFKAMDKILENIDGKVTDNDAWASSGRLQPLQSVGAAKSVLQVEREEVL